jgi:hypothetical protein
MSISGIARAVLKIVVVLGVEFDIQRGDLLFRDDVIHDHVAILDNGIIGATNRLRFGQIVAGNLPTVDSRHDRIICYGSSRPSPVS